MGLMECVHCHRRVSSQAMRCPGCNQYPLSLEKPKTWWPQGLSILASWITIAAVNMTVAYVVNQHRPKKPARAPAVRFPKRHDKVNLETLPAKPTENLDRPSPQPN